jgi:hypothetical protein
MALPGPTTQTVDENVLVDEKQRCYRGRPEAFVPASLELVLEVRILSYPLPCSGVRRIAGSWLSAASARSAFFILRLLECVTASRKKCLPSPRGRGWPRYEAG